MSDSRFRINGSTVHGLTDLTPFDLQPRTRVVFGAGALDRLGELARELGAERALVVSDPGVVRTGFPNRALMSLMRADVGGWLFDSVEENPTTANVDEGAAFARENNVDLIIGLGGGSSIDCAKGINFLATNGGEMADYRGHDAALARPLLPLIAVPTTAGTGSEAQSYALISDAETHAKMACGHAQAAPRIALLDPELTATQPREVAAHTGVDALTHALESWVTKKRTPASALYAREAWRLLSKAFPRAMRDPGDADARSAMLLGAHFAGAAIEQSMLGAAHSCANPLTARFGVVHGEAVGAMMPHVIRYNASAVSCLYDEWGGAALLATQVDRFLEEAQLPRRLSEHGVTEADLPTLAADAAGQWTAQFNPRPVGEAELLEIYRCAL